MHPRCRGGQGQRGGKKDIRKQLEMQEVMQSTDGWCTMGGSGRKPVEQGSGEGLDAVGGDPGCAGATGAYHEDRSIRRRRL